MNIPEVTYRERVYSNKHHLLCIAIQIAAVLSPLQQHNIVAYIVMCELTYITLDINKE